MLQRVAIEGLELPRLYIAENAIDVAIAKSKGIPYLKWTKGMESLIRCLLRPTLEKMFPYIKWNKVLGKRSTIFNSEIEYVEGGEVYPETQDNYKDYDNSLALQAQYEYDEIVDTVHYDNDNDIYIGESVDIAVESREFSSCNNNIGFIKKEKLEDYIGDLSSSVDLEVLQKLNLLPKFMGDIVDCIKVNLSNSIRWTEGYNKRYGLALGNFKGSKELPNLIILDVSGSIPRGISATMLQLMDTMRTQLNAELIITSDKSVYYSRTDELPDPQTLRDYFGYGNEAGQFYKILNEKISGREWGHVISFGDYDSPSAFNRFDAKYKLVNTKIHAVHHYHTTYKDETGYAQWCNDASNNKMMEKHFDTSWCKVIEG